MKKVVLINTVLYGSTGTIVRQLRKVAEENGMEAYTATAYAKNDSVKRDDHDLVIGSFFNRYVHLLLSRFTGYSGIFSHFATKRFIKKLKNIKPDIIHLHNLHNAYINLPVLFEYIKDNNIKTIWTLHDCWAFTGRCPYFDMLECDDWKDGCNNCKYPKDIYPISYVDRSSTMWSLKRKVFNGVEDMTIVTPSQWLAKLVKQSFLAEYNVKVINNGIDLTIFTPTKGYIGESIKEDGKHIVLGVSMDWGKRKGLDVFVELSKRLGDDYKIVLVGTTESVERELEGFGITCIRKTNSQKELAEIYTSASVFVNPTREDNFPTVNLEALACGTPIVAFNTGGCAESVCETCGYVVEKEDTYKLTEAIKDVCNNRTITEEACIEESRYYNCNEKYIEYINIYE